MNSTLRPYRGCRIAHLQTAEANNRVLVIDDNEAIHDDFRKILGAARESGDRLEAVASELFDEPATSRMTDETSYAIDSAFQGPQGLALVEASLRFGCPYALAFVDMRMPPAWNGVETVRRIWNVDPALEVVICTAYCDVSWYDMSRELGQTDRLLILKKPFDNVEIRQMASSLRTKWELARKVEEQTRAIREAHEETIHRLVKASLQRDEETGAHIQRTGWYSELLAATAGWDGEAVEQIRLAAPMHDVGKIGIPDAILRKAGKHTAEETAVMQTHTVIGAKMLSGSTSPVLRMAYDIALCHHEHWDGRGYPAGLAGQAIPESARIVAIVDVYDALSHDRVYHRAFPESKVVELMREGRGTHFDPHLLDVFLSLLPEMRVIAQAVPDEEEELDDELCATSRKPAPSKPHVSPDGWRPTAQVALVR